MTTFFDLVSDLIDYRGLDGSTSALRMARRAVLAAYDLVATGHEWNYFKQYGLINTVVPYLTGTIVYDHTGGTYERQVTLSDGTWPAWAEFGYLRINQVTYEVDEVKSSTVLTLTSGSNPGEDVASTDYIIYRDTYPLPDDFREAGVIINQYNTSRLVYVTPNEWAQCQRTNTGPSAPTKYTYTGNPDVFGGRAIRFYPFPDRVYPMTFIYMRSPRRMIYPEYSSGNVEITSGSSVVTVSGGAFKDDMVGSVIRISSSKKDKPTDRYGTNPYAFERLVQSITNSSTLVVDSDFDQSLSGVTYMISDPVDMDEIGMATFLRRETEKQVRINRRVKAVDEELIEYNRAMHQAWESDSMNVAPRAAGMGPWLPIRMRDMPSSNT